MAGTSGERGGEKRGNKKKVQRFIFFFLKGGACWSDVFGKPLLWLVTKSHAEYSAILSLSVRPWDKNVKHQNLEKKKLLEDLKIELVAFKSSLILVKNLIS